LSLRVENDKYLFRIGHDASIPTIRWDVYELGSVSKNKWSEFVFHIVHSDKSDGLVEIWRDGVKVVTHKGPNNYKGKDVPRWKLGIYKPAWQNRKSATKVRVVYFDNIKIGNKDSRYEDMISLGGGTNTSADNIQDKSGASDSRLVGHWKMDEGKGSTLIDSSPYKNNGSIQDASGVSWIDGVAGKALKMDKPSGRYFAVAPHTSSLNLTKGLTISAWVRPSVVANRMILSKGSPNGYELSTVNNGKFEFRFNRESDGSTYRLRSNKNYSTDGKTWVHVAVTFNGQKSTLFINGVEDASATYSPVNIRSNTSPLEIGARDSGNRWEGDLDDVRLYNQALSATEIKGLATR